MPAQKIDTAIQTRISLYTNISRAPARAATASTIDGKHVRVSKILLTPACLTIAPWLNPEEASNTAETAEEALLNNPSDLEKNALDPGYTLNIKQKEEFSDNDFEDLFKD